MKYLLAMGRLLLSFISNSQSTENGRVNGAADHVIIGAAKEEFGQDADAQPGFLESQKRFTVMALLQENKGFLCQVPESQRFLVCQRMVLRKHSQHFSVLNGDHFQIGYGVGTYKAEIHSAYLNPLLYGAVISLMKKKLHIGIDFLKSADELGHPVAGDAEP